MWPESSFIIGPAEISTGKNYLFISIWLSNRRCSNESKFHATLQLNWLLRREKFSSFAAWLLDSISANLLSCRPGQKENLHLKGISWKLSSLVECEMHCISIECLFNVPRRFLNFSIHYKQIFSQLLTSSEASLSLARIFTLKSFKLTSPPSCSFRGHALIIIEWLNYVCMSESKLYASAALVVSCGKWNENTNFGVAEES